MKNLETLLKNQQPEPSRELAADFTDRVLAQLTDAPAPHGFKALLLTLKAKLHTKIGIVTVTGIVLAGGTAAALSVWPTPSVTQLPLQTSSLPSGNHIVGYDAQNCDYFSSLNGAAPKYTSEKIYYEIRQGSKLTDQQLQTALQGVCEENISNNQVSVVVKLLPKNLPNSFSSGALTVNAISANSITVTQDKHYNPALMPDTATVTYTHFATDVLVYNESERAAYSDIKAGDTVKLVLQDNSGQNTTRDYRPDSQPDKVTVWAIIKIPALTADPTLFYTSVGSDIVRLDPCKTSPTGFCRAYDFTPQQK